MAFYEGAEHAKMLTVGNRAATDEDMESLAGLSSHGEFGVSLAALFSTDTKASFGDDGTEKIRGRETIRLKYSVPLETSRNQISLGSVAKVTAYRGRCWVDPETFQVVRLEDIAVDIPADIPISASSSRTDYDLVEIAGRNYWLPVSANVRMVAESKPGREIYNFYENILGKLALPNYNPRKVEAINSIAFGDYQKFGAEVKVTF
jgi:hypothetical protein